MKTPLFALTALLLTVSASAQNRAAEIDFENALREAQAPAAAHAAKALDRVGALESTLTAMNDGPEVAGEVRSYIQDKALRIVFSDSVVRSAQVGGTIQLGGSLPLYPRVLGPLLARETASLMLSDMPDCAEKRFMQVSLQVRTWLELGGDKSALPVIESLAPAYKDPALSAEFKLWLDNGSELALDKIGESAGVKIIPDLESKAKTADERAMWQAANKRFVAFLIAENEWRRSNGYLLK